jgi:hypothetical protein
MDSAVLFERDVAYEAGALLSPSSKSIHNVSPYEAVLGVPECGMQATVPWLSRERWETLLLDTHAVLARYRAARRRTQFSSGVNSVRM